MTEITVFPDITAKAMALIKSYYTTPKTVYMSPPANWSWGGLLITVSDTGGSGQWTTAWGAQYSAGQITLNVSHANPVEASRIAREIHALLMVWDEIDDEILQTESQLKPVYYPNPDQDPPTPNYQFTFRVTVEGTLKTI